MGKKGFGIDPEMLKHYAQQIKQLVDAGVEVAKNHDACFVR